MNINALFVTLLSGIAFFMGYFITKLTSDKKKLVIFSVGFAFTVLLGLILLDLLPECLEVFDKWYYIIIYALIGVGLLKLLDLLIPDHHHEDNSKDHIEHIGLISFIAVFLHNLIEGTAIYTTSLSDIRIGTLMALGVSCHNIPLGIQISSLTGSNKKSLTMISILAISSILGYFILNIFNIALTENLSGILISVTLGMLVYIVFFELLCEVKEHIKSKEMFYGLFFGIAIILISTII